MNQHPPLQLLEHRHRAAVKAAARVRAVQLRADAQNAFWNAIGRALRRAWTALSARRPLHANC